MATTSVTLADAADFLTQFKSFVTGIASPQTWTCLKDSAVHTDFADYALCTGGDVATTTTSLAPDSHRTGPYVRRIYFSSPGLTGADTVYHCLTYMKNTTVGSHVIELRNMVAFDSTKTLPNQYRVSPPHYIPINNNNNNVLKIVANGRRAIILVKIGAGNSHEAGYIGLGYPCGSPVEVPYPLFTGGSCTLATRLPTDTTADRHCFWDPGGAAATIYNPVTATGSLSTLSAAAVVATYEWLPCVNTNGAYSDDTYITPSTTLTYVLPWRRHGLSSTASYSTAPGGKVWGSSDRTLEPAEILSARVSHKGSYGHLDGVYFTPGVNGLGAEDIIQVAGVDYLIWRNTNHAAGQRWFAAIKWE